MPDPIQATLAKIYPAASVRVTEMLTAMLDAMDSYCPFEQHRSGILDLTGGIEAASLSSGAELDIIVGRLIKNYGLLRFYTDPIRRALAPAIPLAPSTVQYFVLGTGRGTGILGAGRTTHVLGTRIALQQTTAPTYNTDLSPGETIGAVTYDGDPDSVFSFNMPLDASTAGPETMFLFTDDAQTDQVGRIDFPLTAVGASFRIVMLDGRIYYGIFQQTPDNYTLRLS